jgi:hypothetical protein
MDVVGVAILVDWPCCIESDWLCHREGCIMEPLMHCAQRRVVSFCITYTCPILSDLHKCLGVGARGCFWTALLNNYKHTHNMMQPPLHLKIWRVICSNVLHWICPNHFSFCSITLVPCWNIYILYRLPSFHSIN